METNVTQGYISHWNHGRRKGVDSCDIAESLTENC
jgi:hypothetical protein